MTNNLPILKKSALIFTDLDGNEAKVEYTFGYKVVNGSLKIDLHHSSFPYNP